MAKQHRYRRAYCTTLCPRRRNPETDCALCRSLDEADRFWNIFSSTQILDPIPKALFWQTLRLWFVDARKYIKEPAGYRVVVPAIITFVGAYFGLYAIMEARHERRLNRAAFERSTFTALVTSNNLGSFIAAMKRFGPIQTMAVPPEPRILEPWSWWGEASQPNMGPLNSWVRHFFPLCTPQHCGHTTEQSLAVYQELALSDIADEYEAAMQTFPVR